MSTISWIGLALIVGGAAFMWREHRIILDSQITRATVIDLVASRGRKGGTVYAPKVTFVASDGREVVFQSKLSSSSPGVRIGDHVPVAYDQVNPSEARLLLFGYRFGFWYCAVGVGLLLIFIGYGFRNGNYWIEKTYLSSSAHVQR